MDPSISVIIPVFNGEPYIEGAIKSVFDQTFKDFEIIVIDDGSTDATRDCLEKWIREEKIRYIYQENKGTSAARNIGINAAKGRFLKFLDSDDWLYPQQFEHQIQHLINKPSFTISVTDYELEFEGKVRKKGNLWLGNGNQLARFIEGNPCPVHTILVQRSLVQEAGGFDEQLQAFEDSDLWLRLLLKGNVFEKIEYVGCCYRIFKKSLSADTSKYLYENYKFYEKLNSILAQQLEQLHPEAIDMLLFVNTELTHKCFAQKISPSGHLPNVLMTNKMIYVKGIKGIKYQVTSRLMGVKNISLLKYFKNCLKNNNYQRKLLQTTWRDESNYE